MTDATDWGPKGPPPDEIDGQYTDWLMGDYVCQDGLGGEGIFPTWCTHPECKPEPAAVKAARGGAS